MVFTSRIIISNNCNISTKQTDAFIDRTTRPTWMKYILCQMRRNNSSLKRTRTCAPRPVPSEVRYMALQLLRDHPPHLGLSPRLALPHHALKLSELAPLLQQQAPRLQREMHKVDLILEDQLVCPPSRCRAGAAALSPGTRSGGGTACPLGVGRAAAPRRWRWR
ncbi:hypothetical protein DENSPDRAFT_283931 [Dentipellis sp. KUC8613]|nr:hypothetical protein DENSPDRAFT_283931 [Dentipellis sp. KUC8613]